MEPRAGAKQHPLWAQGQPVVWNIPTGSCLDAWLAESPTSKLCPIPMAGNGWLMLGEAGYDLSQLSGNIYGAGNNHLHACYNPAFFTKPTPISFWENNTLVRFELPLFTSMLHTLFRLTCFVFTTMGCRLHSSCFPDEESDAQRREETSLRWHSK